MPESKAFIDTNILLYLLSADTDKADRAEKIVRAGGLISVQVLNEMANVARRKLAMSWMEINEMLTPRPSASQRRRHVRHCKLDRTLPVYCLRYKPKNI